MCAHIRTRTGRTARKTRGFQDQRPWQAWPQDPSHYRKILPRSIQFLIFLAIFILWILTVTDGIVIRFNDSRILSQRGWSLLRCWKGTWKRGFSRSWGRENSQCSTCTPTCREARICPEYPVSGRSTTRFRPTWRRISKLFILFIRAYRPAFSLLPWAASSSTLGMPIVINFTLFIYIDPF